jgi:hypothetical protein
MGLAGLREPSAIDVDARPHQFDDVLGTCGELELMLSRLRRGHLVPDDEFATNSPSVKRTGGRTLVRDGAPRATRQRWWKTSMASRVDHEAGDV